MVSRSFRAAPLLLTLLVGVAIGFVVQCSEKPGPGVTDKGVAKGIFAIVVGPKPDQLNYPKVQISKLDGEVAFWVARTKTDTLRIEFDQEIFEGMTKQANGKWSPGDCGKSRACYSGNINSAVKPGDTEYKYAQILIDKDGQEHSADGHIIINP